MGVTLGGRAIDSKNTISSPIGVFYPQDTIYLSVISEARSSNNSLLTALWSYGPEAQFVNEQVVDVPASAGATATEIHLSKPSRWPLGVYAVEVLVDGQSLAREQFGVVAGVASDGDGSELARPVCRVKRDNNRRIARDRHQVTIFRATGQECGRQGFRLGLVGSWWVKTRFEEA